MRQTRLTDFSGSQRNSCEGEGCRGTTTTTEADQWHSIFYDVAAKCGHPPPVGDNTESPSLPYTSVQKRSYRRACRRAINTGYAHYHGQKLQVTDFPAALVQKLRPCAETAVEALPMKAQAPWVGTTSYCWNQQRFFGMASSKPLWCLAETATETGPASLPTYTDCAPGVPFSQDDLTRAITKLLNPFINNCKFGGVIVMAEPAELSPDGAPVMPPSSPAVPSVNTLSFHVMTQAFWPELQRLISGADWTQFPRNADMLEYLTHHCAICGLWCNRFQELHGHFRQTHPDQVQGCVAKGAQLSVLMQTTSPCSLCQRPYSRVHSCPTALQIGMLVIQLRPEEDRQAVACTCDICAMPFPDLGALYGHLTNTHGLTLNDWCPSRDSHQGGDGCRHCGIIFDSRSGLRRHITEGRCEAFNPAATPHPNDTTEKWGPWLQTCNFEPQALTAHMRLQLTNTCQFCGLAYSRTGDLVAHLLQSHGDLWVGSQPWLRFLLQTVMAKRGWYQAPVLLHHLLVQHPQTCAWTLFCHLTAANSSTNILRQIARLSFRLQPFYIRSMDALMDPNDQALMDGLQALGPLLLGARKHLDGNDDHQPKRHKAAAKDAASNDQSAEAMASMLRLMAQLTLSHERSIQLQLRQDCFVLFAQDRPEGIIPHLKVLAQSWKEKAPSHVDDLKWPNLRTHLMAGVVAELHCRVQQLAASKKGEQLWDLAVEKGTLLPDGSWGYQKWCPESKQLKRAARAPLSMQQMLRNLQSLEELLQSNSHVQKFHSLRTDQSTVPWLLQLSHRDSDAWYLLQDLCQNTAWRNFQYLDWGAQAATLQTILNDNDGTPFPLDTQDWFETLIHGWNDQQGQADSAEFGHRLASWLNSEALSNSWERRVSTQAANLVHDHGDRFMPLTLQLDPAMIVDNEISLTMLLRLWSAELGMCAGLSDPRELLVIHVERLVMTPTGTLYKHPAIINFAWEVQVPVMTAASELCTVPYTVVAVVAHLGDTQGGHYQTMLRTYPEVSNLAAPSMWMFCDDNRLPERAVVLVGQLLQIPTTFFGFYHQHFLHLKLTINFSFSISGLFSGGGSLAFFQYMGWNTATFHAEWATNFYVWLAILAASLALLLDNGPFSAQERRPTGHFQENGNNLTTTACTVVAVHVGQIPSRNNLIALGDWNTSLTKCSTSTGLATYAGDTGLALGAATCSGGMDNAKEAADMLQEWFQQLYNDDSAPLSRTRLQSYPQFAYMRRRGSTPRAVSGGAMLSLDLSKAFDNVNRERLLLCLRRLDISEVLEEVYTAEIRRCQQLEVHAPDLEDVEHRLRVQELIQFARSRQIQALAANQDSSMMDELSIDLHCLVAQAVEQDRAEDLLQHEDIRFFMTTRLEHERQLQPQIAPLPPDLVLSAAEQIEPLLWLGCAHLLYDKVELRIVLTKVCQICGQNCRDGTALQQHLNDAHPHHMEDVRMFKEMFQWSLFQEQGCFCNPSPGWGEPNHECVGLTQLAWIAQSFNWQVVLPWAFKSNELVTELSDALPLQALQRVTLALMARNFHKLWQDTDLEVMLKTRYLLCQEYVSLGYIKSHLSVQHQVTLDKVKYVMPQVAAVFADMNSEVWHCEWCAGLLPTWSTNEEFVPDHLRHMMECPYVMQIALLLMMPKWHSPALQPLTWASQDHIASVRRQHQLQQWQLHAGISDTFGMSMEALAQYGLQFMQDPLIAEQVSFRCLLCTKCFFMSTKFEQHLHTDHNFQQMQTLMCYHRLALHCGSSCQFCGKTHSTDQCIPLLNLAVYLVNGYGIRGAHRPRLSGTDVGSTTQQGTDATTGPDQTQRKNQRQEAAQDWRQSPRSTLTFFFNNGGADRAPSTTGASVTASRRQHQLPDILMEAEPTEDLFQDCVRYHLVVNNKDKTMPFLRWDHQHRCLQPTDAPGIPIAVAYKNICSIVRLMSDSNVTLRFHALKRLQEDQTPQPVPWLWTVSLRNSPELQQQLAALSHHAIWQLIQVRLKPKTLARQPLAVQLQKSL
ncbi:unnamed protein product [Cladocopium goreaui]|uniref:Pentatricopeptide repeat-containing protein, chloroplastic n=1 Tax=Cladocopium goreaui TaxID=2562237 RepID=A0A9P1DUF7_9DINO|nr:unnamed protein product [Cladocopium goreaui]